MTIQLKFMDSIPESLARLSPVTAKQQILHLEEVKQRSFHNHKFPVILSRFSRLAFDFIRSHLVIVFQAAFLVR